MPGEIAAALATPSITLAEPDPALSLDELRARLADPAMPAFSAAELMDGGLSLIHVGPIEDEPAAFAAIASKAEFSGAFADIAGVILGAGGGSERLAAAMINAKYEEIGGAAGLLGPTATAVAATPGGTGWFREYQRGAIYFSFSGGAHEVHDPILSKWRSLGAEAGFVGYPLTDQQPGDDPASRGVQQRFQGASILSFPDWRAEVVLQGPLSVALAKPADAAAEDLGIVRDGIALTADTATLAAESGTTRRRRSRTTIAADVQPAATFSTEISRTVRETIGPARNRIGGVDIDRALAVPHATHEVHGAIRARYDALGGEGSMLGYPTTDETACPDGVGRYNHFEAGSIYWTPSTGAHEVHGLIRDLWARQGWERGALGYPMTDELIPDRRVGHVQPEHRRKPIVDLPFDLLKLPESAVTTGVTPSVVNISPESMAVRRIAALEKTETLASIGHLAPATSIERAERTSAGASILGAGHLAEGPIGRVPEGGLDPTVVSGILDSLKREPASTAAADRSTNRFQEFENGVAFWQRGEPNATTLPPWLHAADGSQTHFVAGEVVDAVIPALDAAFGSLPAARLVARTFIGTTGYTFDGAGVRNRRHRIRIDVSGTGGGFFGGAASAIFTVDVEVTFEPQTREVVAMLADWAIGPQIGDFGSDLGREVHRRLDDRLGTSFTLTTIPDTNAGDPIALLSVKTMANGDVNLFIEPPNPASHWAVLNEARVVNVLRDAISSPNP